MKHPRGAAGGDLIFFIFFLIVLGIVWSLTGGPERSISREGPFLNPPFPLGDGSAYNIPGVPVPTVNDGDTGSGNESGSGGIADIISRIRGGFDPGSAANSPYAGSVTLSTGRAKNSDANEEYLIIKTSKGAEGRITISDWRIESSVSLSGVALGDAAYLPYSGRVNSESPVAIGPNTTVYLVTGRSPIGTSFRTNTCTGYFEQFQDFAPSLKKECPLPNAELERAVESDFIPNQSCVDYVDDIDRCTLTLTSIPAGVGSSCRNFIQNTLTYNGCVDAHKNEADFYKNVWYLYLGRDQELWVNSNERIRLLDENGLVVDSVSY